MSNKDHDILGQGVSPATINVGHGNFIRMDRIVAILESGSLPMKRLRDRASDMNLLIDATAGRKMRSLIVTDSKHVVLSALAPQTVQERLQGTKHWASRAQLELEEGEFVS